MAAQRGTELHQLAADLIRLRQKLQRSEKTLNRYVNDCIGYQMTPEQILFYSLHCYGTADAISFSIIKRRPLLRIFDLKTGEIPAKEDQPQIYAALFCLEYEIKPFELDYDLRIYQNDEVVGFDVDPDYIAHIMDRIKILSARIDAIREEALG